MDQQRPVAWRDRREIDGEHLRTLAIFHFVGGGLALLGLLFTVGHYAIFSAVMTNSEVWKGQATPPPAEIFGAMKVIYLVLGIWTGGSALVNLLAGFFLRARRHRVFLIIVGALNCLHVPLGTVLGVFTLVVLLRDSVRQLFDGGGGTEPPA
jgi:hypothetical protein